MYSTHPRETRKAGPKETTRNPGDPTGPRVPGRVGKQSRCFFLSRAGRNLFISRWDTFAPYFRGHLGTDHPSFRKPATCPEKPTCRRCPATHDAGSPCAGGADCTCFEKLEICWAWTACPPKHWLRQQYARALTPRHVSLLGYRSSATQNTKGVSQRKAS